MSSNQESLLKRIFRQCWRALGSYTLGIVLMGLLLVITFYGTLYQTKAYGGASAAEAAETFFGSSLVLIPIGGEHSPIALPLPGMWIICCVLFVNLLVGGIIRARKGVAYWGVLISHAGILLLLASVALGNKMTTSIDSIVLVPGQVYRNDQMDFGLKLHQFTPEFYPGTGKPKSFESELSVMSLDGKDEGSYVIRMNEPLRIKGWTFYQMSWQDWNGQMISILRGARNPFDHWPKWSSYIITAGLLLHFGSMFVRYLRRSNKRKTEPEGAEGEEDVDVPMSGRKKLILAGIGLFVLALFGVGLMSGKPPIERVKVEGYMPWSPAFVQAMGEVGVEDGGRVKPFSTYAGFRMLETLGKRSLTINTDAGSHTLTPVEWMLDSMLRPEFARQYPVFLVNREEIVKSLDLPNLPEKRKRYSFSQLEDRYEDVINRAIQLNSATSKGDVERDIIALGNNLWMMERWMMMPAIMLQSHGRMAEGGFPSWFPTPAGGWSPVAPPPVGRVFAEASLEARQAIAGQDESLLDKAEGVLTAGFADKNKASMTPQEHSLIDREMFYYRLDPMYKALILFIAGFVVLVIGSLMEGTSRPGQTFRRLFSAVCGRGVRLPWLLGLAGGILLLTGMVLRTLITHRSPVGNTYETIAFIACAGVLITLVMEAVNKRGIALAAGLILGAIGCQMGIIYEAGQASDHMDPLVAVLRSNFLLSTHVITIVLGYAAGLLAGVFSHVFILSRPFNLFGRKAQDALTRMAYGTLCFSLLFTLVGTVFGGIWGNEAWGRFWGWDPKENGALIIILWQLILLHARLAGYIKVWGLHLGNIVGVLLIAFAWWGVNTLGVGLHSYGFSDAYRPLMIFYIAETAVLVVCSFIAWYYRRREKVC